MPWMMLAKPAMMMAAPCRRCVVRQPAIMATGCEKTAAERTMMPMVECAVLKCFAPSRSSPTTAIDRPTTPTSTDEGASSLCTEMVVRPRMVNCRPMCACSEVRTHGLLVSRLVARGQEIASSNLAGRAMKAAIGSSTPNAVYMIAPW